MKLRLFKMTKDTSVFKKGQKVWEPIPNPESINTHPKVYGKLKDSQKWITCIIRPIFKDPNYKYKSHREWRVYRIDEQFPYFKKRTHNHSNRIRQNWNAKEIGTFDIEGIIPFRIKMMQSNFIERAKKQIGHLKLYIDKFDVISTSNFYEYISEDTFNDLANIYSEYNRWATDFIQTSEKMADLNHKCLMARSKRTSPKKYKSNNQYILEYFKKTMIQ